MVSTPAQRSAKPQETEMNTLMINSRTQGISFNASEAVAPFAIVEKIATVTGALLKSVGKVAQGRPVPAFRAAQA
jgi:hypothetical protein